MLEGTLETHRAAVNPPARGQRSALFSNQYFPLLSGDPSSPSVSTSGLCAEGKKQSEGEKTCRSFYLQVEALPEPKMIYFSIPV